MHSRLEPFDDAGTRPDRRFPPRPGRRGAGDRARSGGRGRVRVRCRAAVGQDRARALAGTGAGAAAGRRGARGGRCAGASAALSRSEAARVARAGRRRGAAVFDALETARVEALGARSMGGVRANLAQLAEARVRGDAIVRARTAEEVPLATAVGLHRPPAADRRGAAASGARRASKLVAPWIEEKAGGRARCAGADDRRPGGVREAVAAAARGSRPRRGRGPGRRAARGRRRRGRGRGGRHATTPTRTATRARRPAATWKCAARRPRTAATRSRLRPDGDAASEEAIGRRRGSDEAAFAAPGGATGT